MVIGRGCRREHPNRHCLLLLQVLHNFRLRMHTSKGTPKRVKWPLVTSGSHVTTTKKKRAGGKPGMRRTWCRLGPLLDRASSGHVTDVTSGHVTSGSTTSNTTLSVPIYYSHSYPVCFQLAQWFKRKLKYKSLQMTTTRTNDHRRWRTASDDNTSYDPLG